MKSLFYSLLYFPVGMAALISGCSNHDESRYVKRGDIFFDDAISRISEEDLNKLSSGNDGEIRGFLFAGDKKTCIVLISDSGDVVQHGSDPAFCYDNLTNSFIEKL